MLKSPLAVILYILTIVVVIYFAIIFGFTVWTTGFLIFILLFYITAIILLLRDD